MHRGLQQADIVDLILSFLVEGLLPRGVSLESGGLTKSVHKQILDIGICHSALFSRAVRILWEYVSSEIRLFRALEVVSTQAYFEVDKPGNLSKEEKEDPEKNPAFQHIHTPQLQTGEIRVDSLPRFRMYTSSIRILVIDPPLCLGPEAYARVQTKMGIASLFPRLTIAHIPATFISNACGDPFFCGSSVRDLHLKFEPNYAEHTAKIKDGICGLQKLFCFLETLSINAAPCEDKDIFPALLASPVLVSLKLNYTPKSLPDIISSVLAIHNLQIFEVAQSDYKLYLTRNRDKQGTTFVDVKLQNATRIEASLPWNITRAISQYESIQKLYLSLADPPITFTHESPREQWADFYSKLAEDAPDLQQLSVMRRGHSSQAPNSLFDIQAIEPLFSITSIEMLEMTYAGFSIHLQDYDIVRLADAWPKLRILDLQGSSVTAAPTLNSLRYLAQCCPILEHLKIPIDLSQVPHPNRGDRSHGLRVLIPSFKNFREEDVPAVAAFLHPLFPMMKIKGVWLRKEVELVRLVHAS